MFRIDRRLVNLAGSKSISVRQLRKERDTFSERDASSERDTFSENEDLSDREALTENDNLFSEGDAMPNGEASNFEQPDLADDTLPDEDSLFEEQDGADTDKDEDDNEDEDAPASKASSEAEAMQMLKMYIDAADEELAERAETVMAEAQAKAEKIIRDAENEAEAERKRAYDEGFSEGKEKGEEEGKRSFDEALEKQLEQDAAMLKNTLDELSRELERIKAEQEEVATALAIEIVRKVLNPAKTDLEDLFKSQIKNALRQLTSEGKLVIHVSPAEYERFFPTGSASIELDSGTTVTASVLRDVELEDGDLIIDTEDITINAGLSSQLKYVQLAFEQAGQYQPDEE